VVAILPKGRLAQVVAVVREGYRTPEGAKPMIIETEAFGGARLAV
jgi:hypothetical protein